MEFAPPALEIVGVNKVSVNAGEVTEHNPLDTATV